MSGVRGGYDKHNAFASSFNIFENHTYTPSITNLDRGEVEGNTTARRSSYGNYAGRLQGTMCRPESDDRCSSLTVENNHSSKDNAWDQQLHEQYRAAEQAVGGASQVQAQLAQLRDKLQSNAGQMALRRFFAKNGYPKERVCIDDFSAMHPDRLLLNDDQMCSLFGFLDHECCGWVAVPDLERSLKISLKKIPGAQGAPFSNVNQFRKPRNHRNRPAKQVCTQNQSGNTLI